jgi:hypothetical protein
MDRESYLLHQVHLGKLATDIAAATVSTVLMWQRHLRSALLIAQVPAIVASASLTHRDLSGLRDTRRGRYVLAHMPPAAQAVRFLGQIVAWWAAYRHRPGGIVVGVAIVGAGWSFGLVGLGKNRSPAAPSGGLGEQRTR